MLLDSPVQRWVDVGTVQQQPCIVLAELLRAVPVPSVWLAVRAVHVGLCNEMQQTVQAPASMAVELYWSAVAIASRARGLVAAASARWCMGRLLLPCKLPETGPAHKLSYDCRAIV